MLVALVAGARPNFMKIAPIVMELNKKDIPYRIIHTGQHYDYNMSKVFFDQLSLPEPHYYLGVGSGTHIFQTAKAMLGLETVFDEIRPDLVIVVGDVNSTLAGALASVKTGIPVAHVEAGLRSFDRSMPEEVNRLLTDAVSDFLFTTCEDANENLLNEGIETSKIHFVGNVMIDNLTKLMKLIDQSKILEEHELEQGEYIYITLHRPGNVDNRQVLEKIADAFSAVAELGVDMVFPLHPRTKKNLEQFNLLRHYEKIIPLKLIDPIGYIDSIALTRAALAVLTDSGGLQEESTFLGVPCLTLRPNTERPITVTIGTNILLDSGPDSIPLEIKNIKEGNEKNGIVPVLWDGNTSKRIVSIIKESF